jgi:hypothetical protein
VTDYFDAKYRIIKFKKGWWIFGDFYYVDITGALNY